MSYLIPSVCVLIALSHIGKVQGGAGWEYDGPLGPDQWYTEFENCGGRLQSPINIETNQVLFNRNLQSFDLREYANSEGVTMTLENVHGHTVEVVYGGDPITIRGGSLPDEYVLDQFHFHWGASNNVGSEHLVNNKAAPMEMHIVHHMKKFNRSTSAVNPYGLAVMGVFFQIGEHNPGFEALLSNFPDVVHEDAQKTITPFALMDLVGNLTDSFYYRYFGSLTTPPCYETVIWTLFKNKVTISQAQLDQFRKLQNQRDGEKETSISNDYRPTQPLHERSVTSNDPALLQDAAASMITYLLKDIQELKESCSTNGSTASRVGVGVVVWAVLAAVLVWLPWVV